LNNGCIEFSLSRRIGVPNLLQPWQIAAADRRSRAKPRNRCASADERRPIAPTNLLYRRERVEPDVMNQENAMSNPTARADAATVTHEVLVGYTQGQHSASFPVSVPLDASEDQRVAIARAAAKVVYPFVKEFSIKWRGHDAKTYPLN
jgi:hypothetical protein